MARPVRHLARVQVTESGSSLPATFRWLAWPSMPCVSWSVTTWPTGSEAVLEAVESARIVRKKKDHPERTSGVCAQVARTACARCTNICCRSLAARGGERERRRCGIIVEASLSGLLILAGVHAGYAFLATLAYRIAFAA
jgi:hypothetical protein